jgi:hypothetical protein
MAITAQSQPPKALANVVSSVLLGVTDTPGCVCTQTRANRAGEMPASVMASKRSATAKSSRATVTGVHRWRTTRMSSKYRGSSGWESPKPATSVGPAWQRYWSLSQASGE